MRILNSIECLPGTECITSKHRYTFLSYAAMSGMSGGIIDKLISLGDDINYRTTDDESIAFLASSYGPSGKHLII